MKGDARHLFDSGEYRVAFKGHHPEGTRAALMRRRRRTQAALAGSRQLPQTLGRAANVEEGDEEADKDGASISDSV